MLRNETYDRVWTGILELVRDGYITMRQAYSCTCTFRNKVRNHQIDDSNADAFVQYVKDFVAPDE